MNNNWEFDYSELYNNNNPGRNAQNTAAPEAESPLQGAPGPAGMPGMGVGGAPVPPHAAPVSYTHLSPGPRAQGGGPFPQRRGL